MVKLLRSKDDGQFYRPEHVDDSVLDEFEVWEVKDIITLDAYELPGNNDIGELLIRSNEGALVRRN